MKIVLASASQRRKDLLTMLGVDFETYVSDVCEDVSEFKNVSDAVCELARRKAEFANKNLDEQSIIIAADTVVVIDNKILGKPESAKDAFNMLKSLSGRKHSVYTGICIMGKDKKIIEYEHTIVYFKTFSDTEINAYIKTGETFDKAGGYGIQGKGALFVQKITGDYFNVVGLPICLLFSKLSEFGISVFDN